MQWRRDRHVLLLISRWAGLQSQTQTLGQKPSNDDRWVGGVDGEEVRAESVGEELGAGSEYGRGGSRLREEAAGDGKCAADTSERRSGSGVVTRMFAQNSGVLATSKRASKSLSKMFFRENAGVGSGAGSSNSSGHGVLTILPNSLSSWRPSFLKSFVALVRSRSLAGRSSDGVGEAGARSAGSGGAVLGTEVARGGAGVGGRGFALRGEGGGGPTMISSVGRCRGRGCECELYVRETTSSAGYITYIPGETASRRPLAPSEEVHARLSYYLFTLLLDMRLNHLISQCYYDFEPLRKLETVECFLIITFNFWSVTGVRNVLWERFWAMYRR